MKVIYTLIALVVMVGGMECTAQTVSGQVEGHDYVDLGLPSGTKWATCNVGATKPTEYGDYFAWGETKPKEEYRWSTYKWCNGNDNSITKYRIDSTYGIVDKMSVLEVLDDAATVNWGSAWHTPTTKEIGELIRSCTWEWVADFNGTGVSGRIGTSKDNGNKIFFPACGFRNGTHLTSTSNYGHYWSASLYQSLSTSAIGLFIVGDYISPSSFERYLGLSVRAVTK